MADAVNTMDESSRSSASVEEEKKSADLQHSLPAHSAPNGPQETEANILPDTSDETKELDLEKADAETQPAKTGPMGPSSFPDGGWEAWLAVSGAFACLFCSFGWINGASAQKCPLHGLSSTKFVTIAIGVFQTYYETHQLASYSPSTIAWIPSLEVFMMFAGGPIWGKVYDNYGPRYLILVGSFFNVFGLMMTSIRCVLHPHPRIA